MFTKQIFEYYNNSSDLLSKGLIYRVSNDDKDMARQFNHLMYRRFFKIKQSLMKDYLNYKEKFTFNDKSIYKIGIHFRTGNGDFSDNHVFLKPNQHKEFIRASSIQTNIQEKMNKTVIWYIASDSTQAINIFQNNSNGVKCFSINDLPILHTKFDNNKNNVKRAIFDMMFLSECDYHVLTAESSFSYASFILSQYSLLGFTNKSIIIEGYKFEKQ